MTTPYHRIGRNAHRLPAGYFDDAPTTLSAPENLGRSEQSGAESREVSGGSGADSISIARHASGVGHRAYAVAADRISHGQQLRAARTIFGWQP